jgi:hypothetical protein
MPSTLPSERWQTLVTDAEALATRILARPAATLHPDTIALARLVLALVKEAPAGARDEAARA